MKETCVMDSSAILALIGREGGAEVVESRLAGSIMSALSWAEIVVVLQNIGMTSRDIEEVLKQLSVRVVSFDLAQANVAASLHRITHTKGIPLAGRACLALARMNGIPAITVQETWADLYVGAEIVLVR